MDTLLVLFLLSFAYQGRFDVAEGVYYVKSEK